MSVHAILRRGATERRELDKLQDEIVRMLLKEKELEAMPPTVEEWRDLIIAQLDRRSHGYTPATWFRNMRTFDLEFRPTDLPPADINLIAWLLGGPAALVDMALKRMPEETAQAGISAMDRAEKLAALQKRLRELELAEARELTRLEDLGYVLVYRENLSPGVLLEAWGEAKPATEGAPT